MLPHGMYDNNKIKVSITLRDVILCILTLPVSITASSLVVISRGLSKLWYTLGDIKLTRRN